MKNDFKKAENVTIIRQIAAKKLIHEDLKRVENSTRKIRS